MKIYFPHIDGFPPTCEDSFLYLMTNCSKRLIFVNRNDIIRIDFIIFTVYMSNFIWETTMFKSVRIFNNYFALRNFLFDYSSSNFTQEYDLLTYFKLHYPSHLTPKNKDSIIGEKKENNQIIRIIALKNMDASRSIGVSRTLLT